MKRILALALIMWAAFPLAACNTITPPGALASLPAPVKVAQHTLADEKALYDAEAAYNVAAHAYVTADAKGLLQPGVKAAVKPVMLKLYDGLKLARAAYAAFDAKTLGEQANALVKLKGEALALIPK